MQKNSLVKNLRIRKCIMSGTSVITNRDRDCLACRLVSGTGLIGAGTYVSYHSKKFNKTPGKVAMYSIASALVLLGSARILNLPPFRHRHPID